MQLMMQPFEYPYNAGADVTHAFANLKRCSGKRTSAISLTKTLRKTQKVELRVSDDDLNVTEKTGSVAYSNP
jgi:hypothetical protein